MKYCRLCGKNIIGAAEELSHSFKEHWNWREFAEDSLIEEIDKYGVYKEEIEK
jgi:predicted RNA-binding protein with PIN domain